MSKIDLQNRSPEVLVLPDLRLRVTRVADILNYTSFKSADFLAGLQIAWGTADPDYPQCLLISQTTPGQGQNPAKKPNDPPPQLVRVYEQIDPALETPVGNADVTIDQDDITTVTQDYLQFSTGTPVYQVPGVTAAPAPFAGTCVLQSETRTDDGTLRRIKRVYVSAGQISITQETRNEGALLMQTLVYLRTVPPTPSGYTVVSQKTDHVLGCPLYTYTFAKGNGIVSSEVETKEGGVLIIYRRTEFNPSGSYTPATPSSTIGGTVTLISQGIKNEDGFYSYTSVWAEGIGEISRDTEYALSPDQGVTGITWTTIKRLAPLSVGSNPITGPGGSVLTQFSYDSQDGYNIWTAKYASGTGLIQDDKEIKEGGKLYIYTRVSLNGTPSTPSASIGGTVVPIEENKRNGTRFENGCIVYQWKWAEGNGTIDTDTHGEPDGALIQTLTTLTASASTPTSPGAGWYLINLDQKTGDGYYINRGVYKKPPATITFKKKVNFTKPGSAAIGGSPIQFTLSQQVTMTLLADVEVSYDTSQITDVPFTVSAWATYYESYTPTATKITVSSSKSLGGYLAGASGTSGTNSVFNGVLCDSWSYSLGSSTPSSFGTGSKVLDTDNDPYLVATDGTVVYRRTKVSYTF